MAKKIDVDKYVAGLFGRTEQYAENVRKYYAYAVEELLKISANQSLEMGDLFSFKDNKRINEKATIILRQLYSAVYGEIKRGVSAEWEYANLSADALIQSIFGKGIIKDNHFAHWFGRNQKAMDAFFARAQGNGGLNLSQKVWKYTGNLRDEMELALSLSLGEGGSASSISRRVRQYLQEPDKLFRRIKIGVDANGEPLYKLSKKASEYHPGQGVYRSSYKNAMRLTRTETNMAYRSADYERWQQLPFVVGIEIKLSNNHNCVGIPKGRFVDICDELKGKYPKDFKFTGWHPCCRCHAVPILKTVEEIATDNERIIKGEPLDDKSVNKVKDVPDNFKSWLDRNRERVKTTTFIPYFIKDNGKYIPKDWVDGIGSLVKGRNKGIITDVKEAVIKMKDPTFVTEKEVRTMIEKYATAEPDDFYGGLMGVKMAKENDGTIMACERLYSRNTGAYAFQYGNTIKIYKTDHSFIDPLGNVVVFNPLHEVKEAMKSIAAQIPLSFNQEYAIESLWHEIRHAGAIGWKDIRKQTEDLTAAMECINQFCARRSYGKFLRAIGGSVSHKKEIMKSGYGYSRSVRHFEEMLAALNVSSSEAYAHFSKMIMVEPYENIFGNIVQFLVGKGVDKQKAEMLIKTLRHSDDMFGKVLTSV